MPEPIFIEQKATELTRLLQQLSQQSEPVVITDADRKLAVLMDYDTYQSWLETIEILSDPELVAALKEAEQDVQAGNTFSFEHVTGEPL